MEDFIEEVIEKRHDGATVDDVLQGIRDVGLKCLLCGNDDFELLTGKESLNVLREQCEWHTKYKSAYDCRIECTSCGYIMEFNTTYFVQPRLKRVLKKAIKEKQKNERKVHE